MAKTWNWDASAMGTDDWTYWKSLRVTQAREPSLASRFDHKKDDGSYWVWRIELNRTESSWICFPSGRGPFPLNRFGLEMNSIKWSFPLLLQMLSVWLSQAILRWLKTVYSAFQDVDGHYYYSLSVGATVMVSKNCRIIGEHVGIIFVTQ